MTATELEQGVTILWRPGGLIPDPDQPRQAKDWDIPGTAANIVDLRERGLGLLKTGVLNPVKVRLPSGALDTGGRLKSNTVLPIVDGEGRWHSANYANEHIYPDAIPFLPITLQDVGEEDAFEIAYYANAFTTQMSDFDHARALLRIKKRHNLSYNQLAERTHFSRDIIRTHLKAVANEDVWPVLEARPNDALFIARRINQVADEGFRRELIQLALDGAKQDDIRDAISAKNAGLSLKQFRAQREINKYERAHAQEAEAAKSTTPTKEKRTSKGRSSSSSSNLPSEIASANTAMESGNGLLVQPYVGDALDTLTRQLEDAKNGLLEAQLTPQRRTDLLIKARNIRALSDELITGLERGLN